MGLSLSKMTPKKLETEKRSAQLNGLMAKANALFLRCPPDLCAEASVDYLEELFAAFSSSEILVSERAYTKVLLELMSQHTDQSLALNLLLARDLCTGESAYLTRANLFQAVLRALPLGGSSGEHLQNCRLVVQKFLSFGVGIGELIRRRSGSMFLEGFPEDKLVRCLVNYLGELVDEVENVKGVSLEALEIFACKMPVAVLQQLAEAVFASRADGAMFVYGCCRTGEPTAIGLFAYIAAKPSAWRDEHHITIAVGGEWLAALARKHPFKKILQGVPINDWVVETLVWQDRRINWARAIDCSVKVFGSPPDKLRFALKFMSFEEAVRRYKAWRPWPRRCPAVRLLVAIGAASASGSGQGLGGGVGGDAAGPGRDSGSVPVVPSPGMKRRAGR